MARSRILRSTPISKMHGLKNLPMRDIMELTDEALYESARYAREVVNRRIREFEREGLDFAMAELSIDEGQRMARVTRDMSRTQLINTITAARDKLRDDMFKLSKAKSINTEWEGLLEQINAWNRGEYVDCAGRWFNGEDANGNPLPLQGEDRIGLTRQDLLEMARTTSWWERLTSLGYESGETYQAIISNNSFSGALMQLIQQHYELGLENPITAMARE